MCNRKYLNFDIESKVSIDFYQFYYPIVIYLFLKTGTTKF